MKHALLPALMATFFSSMVALLHAGPATYQLNERIEVNVTGAWDKATIIEVGGGDHPGEFKVHYDGWASSYDRWLKPDYFRKATGAAPSAPTPQALAATYQLNERIEVNTLGSWDKATIIEVGTGEHEHEFKVHYDGYAASFDRWLLPLYFRKAGGGSSNVTRSATPAPAATTTPPPAASPAGQARSPGGPRLGRYNIQSYGAVGRPPLYLGHIEFLAGGRYRISNTAKAEYYGGGDYAFDAAASTIQWLSGPCKDNGWTGTFTIERDGRTHKVRLRSTTIATNSTD